MFEKETVFILGAGASVPYGYPTGAKLLEQLNDLGSKIYSKNDRNRTLIRDTPHFKDFYKSHFYSQISIDSFLRDNPNLFKSCVRLICSHFFTLERKNIFDLGNQRDWIKYIIEEMCKGTEIAQNPEKILENKVKFITFNYDKSLEKYIYTALINKEKFQKFAADFINSENRIIHVYGDLYKFNFETHKTGDFVRNTNDYGSQKLIDEAFNEYDNVYNINQPNIVMIGGGKQSTNSENAKKILSTAERIFCLGYAFDEDNNRVIGLDELLKTKQQANSKPFMHYTNFSNSGKIDDIVRGLAPELLDFNFAELVKKHHCDAYELFTENVKL